jgi:predicted Fe-Mo cluster-binding NifX family protein
MNVVIPIMERDPDSTVCLLGKCACFALMALDEENRIKMIDFFDDRERLFDSCDLLVVMEGDEEAEQYAARGVRVLTAPYGSTIEDIHEAIMFSQLRELG